MKIKLTSIPVKDPIKAFEFYTKTLGFQELMYMPEAQLAIVVSPEDPKGTALLLEPQGADFVVTFQKAVYDKGLPFIVLGSEDVSAEYAKLKDKGVVFKQEPTKTDWGIIAMFDDTFGNYIQIHQDL